MNLIERILNTFNQTDFPHKTKQAIEYLQDHLREKYLTDPDKDERTYAATELFLQNLDEHCLQSPAFEISHAEAKKLFRNELYLFATELAVEGNHHETVQNLINASIDLEARITMKNTGDKLIAMITLENTPYDLHSLPRQEEGVICLTDPTLTVSVEDYKKLCKNTAEFITFQELTTPTYFYLRQAETLVTKHLKAHLISDQLVKAYSWLERAYALPQLNLLMTLSTAKLEQVKEKLQSIARKTARGKRLRITGTGAYANFLNEEADQLLRPPEPHITERRLTNPNSTTHAAFPPEPYMTSERASETFKYLLELHGR